MKTLLLVVGKRHAGKDTFSKLLSQYIKHEQIDMTGYLKEKVAGLFGITVEELDKRKDEVIPGLDLTYRHFLQYLGNDYLVDVGGKYCLLEKTQESVNKCDFDIILVTGIRLEKEIKFFKTVNPEKKVIVVKLVRHNYQPLNKKDDIHITETGVDLLKPDYTIAAESLEELQRRVEGFAKKIESGII